ncbi:restriction endonuclease subunit S [Oceanidesulfovibrio marinus]|uniref:Restriction endonuclease subunit S n=1 Tax=Oceanidesulfovibrio marinus TaxID=370038 RepID=A0A6P1ZCN9_9BACT|nr:restriction endonuclease subunit S [Oceanidesulfovibrio marinus]TVM30458.1 restriction endonuclease subunit S [Oceanidesulfovibrio marinus]
MGKYKAYPEYKDSGVDWLGEVPAHWEVKDLKYLARIILSNVDKKSVGGQADVLLCNYTDVYYNETITDNLEFMKATATEEQIRTFTLRKGDTLVTKDSEDPNDIAVPAYVPATMGGILCGYHLAIIRPKGPTQGGYISRFFQSRYADSWFATRANGLTRYGLGSYALSNAPFLSPPPDEQTQIAEFLDHETAKIDRLIAKQEELIALLQEKRQAVISHAVTKGLDPAAPMKDSGVEWLGKVPAHWEVKRAKWVFKERDERSSTGDEELLTVSHITGVSPRSEKDVNMIMAESFEGYKICKADDLVINTMWAWMGAMGTSRYDGIVSPSYNVYSPRNHDVINSSYFDFLVRLPRFITVATSQSKGIWSSRLRLYPESFFKILIPTPPKEEQDSVVQRLKTILLEYKALVEKAQEQIALLQERRTALISAAVTGKIDVREWTP